MKLEQTFDEYWPMDRLYVRCGVCGEKLYEGTDFSIDTPSYASKLVRLYARHHNRESGHASLDIGIDHTIVTETVDDDITVNVK